MANRKISIRQWTMIQIIPGVAVFANYYIGVQAMQQNAPPGFIVLGVTILILIALLLIRKKRDVMDESAKQVMDRANSLCFKGFFIYCGGVAVLVSLLTGDATIVGYMITGGITATTIARAISVSILDSRGLENG